MPTPSIQTLVTDAQQILNLDSISAVRSVVAVALANANTGTPLNPNLTTQQLWNEFYQVVNKPKSDIESIIANQLMKMLYAPPAPGGAGANTQVMFNDNGFLAGDSGMTYDKVANALTLLGNLTVRTNKLAVTSTGTGFGTASPGAAYIADFLGDVRMTGAQTLIGNQSITGDVNVTGTVTASGGVTSTATNSALRAAANDLNAVMFDGTTADSRITSNLTGQNIGTGDFSIWARFRVPSTVNSINRSIVGLSSSAATPLQAESIHLFLAGNAGELAVRLYGAATADLRQATINGFLAAYTGQVVDAVITRTGTTLKMYVNGVDTAYVESTSGSTPPAWNAAVTSTICNVGAGFGGALCNTRVYRVALFNRTLSAADVTELGTTGINPADQWGTQTQTVGYNPAVLNGGFETNLLNATGTWATNATGTSTATIDTSGSFSRTGTNAGKFTLDGSGSFAAFIVSNNQLIMALGKRYRVSFWARKGASSGSCGVQYGPVSGTTLNTGFTLTTTYANFVSEFVQDGSAQYNISRYAGSAANSEIYIDDVEINRVGAFLDLDLTTGSGSFATDRSSNNLSGVFFGAGVSWSPTSNAQDISSAAKASASDYAAAMFDGTANTRIASPCQALGTGDFSIWNRFRVPASIPSGSGFGVSALSDLNNTAARGNAIQLTLADSGTLAVTRYGATTSDRRTASIVNFRQSFSGQIVDVVFSRSGNTFRIYANGVLLPFSETTAGTPPAWGDSIVSDFMLVGAVSSTAVNVFQGRIYRAVTFNRLLSQSDVVELTNFGVNPADQWGTQTGQTSGTLSIAKRYRITTYVASDSFTNVGAASNATGIEFVATGTTPTTWTNASTLNRIGGIVDLDFTIGAGYQAHDRSTNALHGTLFNGVTFTMPRRMAVLYATTNTNGNQQMLGTLALPTNAIIEDIIVNSSGSATVSIGNASAGTQIVNAAAVVAGRQKLTLATPFSTTGNLWVNSSSTATLQFTILYTVAS